MPEANTPELTCRTRVAARVNSVKPDFDPGIVHDRNVYALSDEQYAELCRSQAQPKVRGCVIEYLGWTEALGAAGYVTRILRYSLVFLMEYEEEIDLGGGEKTTSFEVFVALVEAIADAFRRNPALVRDLSGNSVVTHHFLQAENDFDFIQIDERRRAHFLAASLDVEVDANADQEND